MLRHIAWPVLISMTVAAQEKWVKIREFPATPVAMDFDGSAGYVVCKDGKHDSASVSSIFITADAGAAWSSAELPGELFAVQALGDSVAYAAGDRGLVYKTLDGGRTWKPLPTPYAGQKDVGLLSLCFLDAEHGFVAGVGKMLRTGDGGASWTVLDSRAHPALGLEIIESVQFPEAGFGFAAGNGKVLRTTDGGATWQAPDPLPHNPLYILSMHFLDGATGFATGNVFRPDLTGPVAGRVYGTTDGGTTWSVLLESNSMGRFPEKIRFVSAKVGYGVSFQAFFKTVDGGATWRILDGDAGLPLDSSTIGAHDAVHLDFSSDGNGYALNGSRRASGIAAPAHPLWKLTNKTSNIHKPSQRSHLRKTPASPRFRRGARFDASGRWFSAAPGF
jgi:photosystem II stability/assembly factor-like uncharacterized protein